MRYLFVHQNAPAQYKHIIARVAAKPGNEVVVLCQNVGRPLPSGVRRIEYKPVPAEGPPNPWLRTTEEAMRNADAVMRVARELKAKGFTPDIMLGHNAWGETLFLKDVWPDVPLLSYFEFFYAARGQDCGFDPEFPSGPDDWPRTRIMNTINLLGLQATDWGQSPTNYQRTRYPAVHQPRISVFHEGIDTAHLKPNPAIQVALPDGSVLTRKDEVITYVSRSLEPYRGFHVFMRALPEILRRRPKARVLVVGGDDVSYGARLAGGKTFREALIAEQKGGIDLSRVHFFGRVPYEHYLGVLQVSSVHIYLTYPFVLSWSMLEAMSAGCLVVGSDTDPVKEVIQPGVNGLLTGFFDKKGLADRIDEVLDHPDRMQTIRDAARRTVLERYDLNSVCMPQYDRVIEDLLNRRTPPAGYVPFPTAPTQSPAVRTAAPEVMTLDQAIARGVEAERAGNIAAAETIYREILGQRPILHALHYRLGLMMFKAGRFAEAAASMGEAARLQPSVATYHCDLGVALKALGRHPERLASYKRAAILEPDNENILMNLGSALADEGFHQEAEAVLRRAHILAPGNFGVLTNLGNAEVRSGNIDRAVRDYGKAIILNPTFPDVRKNLGMCLMLKGDLPGGAVHYEARLDGSDALRRDFTQPRWDGGPFKGKTLLIHAEQGMGDVIQFSRYVPMAKRLGGRVVLECQPPLVSLMRTLDGVDDVIAKGETPPPFDLYCPIMSLPLAFGTDLSTIPADIPYFKVDADKRKAWRRRLTGTKGLKVGLVWAGSPTFGADRHRSIGLDAFRPLLDVPGTAFFGLQVGPARDQVNGSGLQSRVTDLAGDLKDFTDTAALVAELDLIISVDTAVAHLAGAIGRPAWVLLPHAWLDWRWLLDRSDSPWYPSIRLIRQARDQDWLEVLHSLVEPISTFSDRRS